jgi:hypothetical protein
MTLSNLSSKLGEKMEKTLAFIWNVIYWISILQTKEYQKVE